MRANRQPYPMPRHAEVHSKSPTSCTSSVLPSAPFPANNSTLVQLPCFRARPPIHQSNHRPELATRRVDGTGVTETHSLSWRGRKEERTMNRSGTHLLHSHSGMMDYHLSPRFNPLQGTQAPPTSPNMPYYPRRPARRRRSQARMLADSSWLYHDEATRADSLYYGTVNGAQPLRSMNMNAYPSQQPSRQAPRLQNVNKSGLGNGAGAGWGGFGLPGAGGGFGGLGGAPGLAQARPGQLSGFAQAIGGGSGQPPIDMR